MMRLVSRAGLLPVSAMLGFAAMALPAGAQQNGVSQQIDDIRNAFGFARDRPPIDFSERPPLVVPPNDNLPPPASTAATLGVNDPDLIARRKALTDPRRPVPPSDPGAHVPGLAGRTYLIDPPAGLRDPNAVAADITTDKSAPAVKTSRHRRVRRKAAAVEAAQ